MKKWKQTAGFTLVELIVVIAILGILAGVGTVGYSGYIKKANMAADQQLVSGIKNAIELAYYSDPMAFNAADSVILTTDGIGYGLEDETTSEIESSFKKAVLAAYGDDSGLALKYNGWKSSKADVVALLQQQGEGAAAAVAGSGYAENIPQMLNDAQNCTSALAYFLGEFTQEDMERSFTKLAGNLEEGRLEEILQKAGLATTQDGLNYDLTNAETTTNTQLSNAVILAVAGEASESSDKEAVAGAWATSFFEGSWGTGTGMSTLSDTAARYAGYESFVKYMDDSTLNTVFSEMNAAFRSANSKEAVLGAMDTMNQAIVNYTRENRESQKITDYFGDQIEKDAQAFSSVMGAVSSMKNDFATAEILSQDEMCLSSDVANTVNAYVAAARNYDSIKNVGENDAVLALYYSLKDGVVCVTPDILNEE